MQLLLLQPGAAAPKVGGTYVLAVEVGVDASICFRGRCWLLRRGCYLYTGSAWGPGGLAARISRHFRVAGKRLWWHIDFLLDAVGATAWALAAPGCRGEVCVADCLASLLDPIDGFGSSDSRARSHLARCWGSTCARAALKCLRRCCLGG